MTSGLIDNENESRNSNDAGLSAPSAALFRALGEPARLTLLRHLFTGEHQVRELTEHLGLAQSTVSNHLACLRDCGLVTVRQRGRSSIYAIADPGRLATLIAAAEDLLAGGGSPISCPHLGDATEGVPR
ncbi:MAG TPA: metalloregulator ArsR/SmtB family transcription factor [Cellulomonas sp.]